MNVRCAINQIVRQRQKATTMSKVCAGMLIFLSSFPYTNEANYYSLLQGYWSGLVMNLVAQTALICICVGCVYIGAKSSIRFIVRTTNHGATPQPFLITQSEAVKMPVTMCLLLILLYYSQLLEPEKSQASGQNRLKKSSIGFNISTVLILLLLRDAWSLFPSALREAVAKCKPSWIANREYNINIGVGIPAFSCDRIDIIARLFSCAIAAWYISSKHWMANNILASAIAISGIEYIHFDSIGTGCLSLGLLLVYDVFWVYGTNVMKTLALNIDAPVKVLLPTDLTASAFQLLGVGDIVVPGIFLAFLLRYDKRLSRRPIYFCATLIAYVVSLLATNAIAILFNRGQPALLFIVPAIVMTPICLAYTRGELRPLFSYKEVAMPEVVD